MLILCSNYTVWRGCRSPPVAAAPPPGHSFPAASEVLQGTGFMGKPMRSGPQRAQQILKSAHKGRADICYGSSNCAHYCVRQHLRQLQAQRQFGQGVDQQIQDRI